MHVVVLDSHAPFAGEGVLWKAAEGEPAYRRVVDVADGEALDRSTAPPGVDRVWVGRQLQPGDLHAPPSAAVLLMMGHDPAEGSEDEFNAWMDEEHLPALAAVPGVLAARRYGADRQGFPPYFALYHLSEPGVLTSDAWRQAGGSARAERVRERMRGRVRGLFVPADEQVEVRP